MSQEILERCFKAFPRYGQMTFHLAVVGQHGAIEFHFAAVSEAKFHPDFFPLSPLGVEMHRRCNREDANRDSCHWLDGTPCMCAILYGTRRPPTKGA
jgi:hypothetical protein